MAKKPMNNPFGKPQQFPGLGQLPLFTFSTHAPMRGMPQSPAPDVETIKPRPRKAYDKPAGPPTKFPDPVRTKIEGSFPFHSIYDIERQAKDRHKLHLDDYGRRRFSRDLPITRALRELKEAPLFGNALAEQIDNDIAAGKFRRAADHIINLGKIHDDTWKGVQFYQAAPITGGKFSPKDDSITANVGMLRRLKAHATQTSSELKTRGWKTFARDFGETVSHEVGHAQDYHVSGFGSFPKTSPKQVAKMERMARQVETEYQRSIGKFQSNLPLTAAESKRGMVRTLQRGYGPWAGQIIANDDYRRNPDIRRAIKLNRFISNVHDRIDEDKNVLMAVKDDLEYAISEIKQQQGSGARALIPYERDLRKVEIDLARKSKQMARADKAIKAERMKPSSFLSLIALLGVGAVAQAAAPKLNA